MPLPRNNPVDLERLTRDNWWGRVDIREPDECWPWTQSTASHGYGQTWDGITVRLAHRVAWALHHQQQVPDDMTIDHRPECIRICCNPAHLRPATNVDNARDNGQGRKTHCPHGHPYEGDNLKIYTHPKTGKSCRKCAACVVIRNAKRYAR